MRGSAARVAATVLAACATACATRVPSPAPADGRADWHTHLSLEAPGVLDSLVRNGVTVVRDCGGDLDRLLDWRQRIRSGTMVGPRLLIAGPLLDGPKPGAPFRLLVADEASAITAVDSLAARGVDFLKVHNAVPPAAFFAVLRRARAHGLPVAVHLPRGITAWSAVDSGAASIEHAAESLVASPITAGLARTPAEAMAWWRSAAADSILAVWAARGVVVVPTLVRYEATVSTAPDSLQGQRAALLPDLVALVGRLHRAGVTIAAGTDVAGVAGAPPTWRALRREIELLAAAGLTDSALRSATAPERLAAWRSAPAPAADTAPAAVVRAYIAAYNAHDIDAVVSFLTPDFTWINVVGDSVSIEARGPADIRAQLAAYFRELPTARSELEDVTVLGPWVSARERAHWVGARGPRSQASLSVYEVRRGRLRRVWYYPVVRASP